MRLPAALLAFAVLSSPALAGSHLVPEDSPLALLIPNAYRLPQGNFLQSLAPIIGGSLRIFSIEYNSPFPESLIGLKTADSVFYIFGAQPPGPTSAPPPPVGFPLPHDLMGTDGKLHPDIESPAKAPEPPRYHLNVCRADIDAKLAERVVRVWDSVLIETRPDPEAVMNRGVDGADEVFVSNMQHAVITGAAIAVDPDSRPALLSRLSYDLTAICWKWGQPVKDGVPPAIELEQTLKKLEAQ